MTTLRGTWRTLTLFAFLLLVAVSVAWAQGETIELEGVGASVPSGWVAVSDPNSGSIYVASDQAALDTLAGGGGAMTGAQIGISIAAPSSLGAMGIDSNAAPTVALESFLSLLGSEASVAKENGFSVAAASVVAASEMIPGGEALFYAFAFPEGTVVVALQKGDEAADYLTEEVLAVLNSIAYTPPTDAPVATDEPPVATEEPIIVEGAFYAFGGLNVPVPEGWVTYEQGQDALLLGADQATIDSFVDNESIPQGSRAYLVIPPSVFETIGLTAKTPQAQLAETVEGMGLTSESDATPVDGAQLATWSLFATIEDSTDRVQILLVDAPAGRFLVFSVSTDDPALYAEETLAFVNGITFQEGATEPAEVGVEVRQWAASASGSSQYGTSSWSFEQATGEPNTDSCGDLSSAWASGTATGKDQLVLTYDEAIIPTQVNIYQTYNPGAIILIALSSSLSGASFDLPDSADAIGNTPCPGVFTVDVSGINEPVDTVTIFLDQTRTGSWNEIDAVELVGVAAE